MDTSRKIYHSVYYKLHKTELNNKSLKRYRDNHEEIKKKARERYTPKTQRHSIYRETPHTMLKIAFITGGLPYRPAQELKDKFKPYADILTKKGYQVLTPTALDSNASTWPKDTTSDLKKMLDADELHLLPDWESCRSAKLLHKVASTLGKTIIMHHK